MTRNSRERLCLVANPRSAGGATSRRLDRVRAAAARWFDRWEIRLTERPGHATELAAAACAEGADIVLAVGGDGTANEVANGLFEGGRLRNPEVAFGILPAGTGGDLARTLGTPRDAEEAIRRAATGSDRRCDVLRIHCLGNDGAEVDRIGVNVTGFGMNGEVVRYANRSSKRLGGTLTFLGATCRALVAYTPTPVALTWTDAQGREGGVETTLVSAFVANAQFCGGGMWVGRGGVMDDGLAELTVIPKMPLLRQATGLRRLFDGSLGGVPGVTRVQVSRLEARALGPVSVGVDVDGEQPGELPLRLEVLPRVLKIRGLWADS